MFPLESIGHSSGLLAGFQGIPQILYQPRWLAPQTAIWAQLPRESAAFTQKVLCGSWEGGRPASRSSCLQPTWGNSQNLGLGGQSWPLTEQQ